MATQAVKFYSVASLPSQPNNAALYFVNGGELYKGTQRFGANKVYTANAETVANTTLSAYTEGLTDLIAGDILLGFQGAKVWDGAAWQDLSADIQSIIASVASTFTTGESDGQLKLGSVNATVNGWDYVDFLKSIVTSETENETTTTVVTANTGTFDNLTVDGKTVPEIAAEVIASISEATQTATDTDAGITVSVTTSGGSVTGVSVAGPSIATVIRAASEIDDTRVASEGAVRAALSTFDNALHFAGVATPASYPTDAPTSGDIVVIGPIGSEATLGFDSNGSFTSTAADVVTAVTEGQEYIYDGTKWEKIGDQSAVTGGTSSSTVNGVTVEVVTAAATAFPSVTISGLGTAASVDFATQVTESADTLPTGGAVYTFVNGLVSDLDSTPTDAGSDGVSVAVVEEDGIITGVTTTVTKATLNATLGTTEVADKGVATSIGPATSTPASGTEGQEGYVPAVDAASNDNLATEKAVRDAITSAVNTAELVWLDENDAPIDDSPAPDPEEP